MPSNTNSPPRVGLFATCLVDLFRPSVGFAAVKLLEDAGCTVEVPENQTCCGQPGYNAGDHDLARDLARGVIKAFADVDYLVAPSGSCAAMIRLHYPGLFADEPETAEKARELAGRTYELTSFLVDVLGMTGVEASFEGKVTYHDACSGLRELGIKSQPRKLLQSVAGLELVEVFDAETCCGFGGTFSVKYPEVSVAMAAAKTKNIESSAAHTVLAGDMGCLMNLAGRLSGEGSDISVRHVAEVLAGVDGPAIARRTK